MEILEYELEGHSGVINDIISIYEDDFLISASDDGSIRIWNISNKNTIKIFKEYIFDG